MSEKNEDDVFRLSLSQMKKTLWDGGLSEHLDQCDVEDPDHSGPLADKLARAVLAGTRSFVLHDGEDDAKSEELHQFMLAAGLEWEGDNSGITIWLAVGVGDTIEVRADGSLRIVRKEVKP